MKALDALIDTFKATDGNSLSMMRVVVTLIILAILVNWTYLTIHTGVKQPLDWTEVSVILGALGMKVAQRPFEAKPAEAQNVPITQNPTV